MNNLKINFLKLYYVTHPLFMSNNAIYIVVWNMRDNKGKEGLEYWLNSIVSRTPTSQVIVVGTHLDEGSEVSVDYLKNKYQIIECFFSVSCVGKLDGIEQLREKLISMVTNQSLEIPHSYIMLAESITSNNLSNFLLP